MHHRSVAALLMVAAFAPRTASAERCPTAADMPKGVTLRQRKSTVRIRATGEHAIRTETTTQDVGTFVDTTYDGLVPIGSRQVLADGDTTRRFVSPTDDRTFRPEPGRSFTDDTVDWTGGRFFGVESTDTTDLKVVGRDTVRIGDCSYRTVTIETIVAEGMRGITSDQVPEPRRFRLQFSPDLRIVLYGHRAILPPVVPDSFTAD